MPRVSRVATIALLGGAVALASVVPAYAAIVPAPITFSADGAALELRPIGTYETGILDRSAAEIVAYFPAGRRMLVVNAAQAKVEVLSIADPTAPAKLFDLQTTGIVAADGSTIPSSAVANSVAVRADGLGVVAIESDVKTDLGWVVFFDASGSGAALGAVRVGSLPDSLIFSPDGTRVVVANEGEPAEDYSVDPEGAVSVITVPASIAVPAQSAVATAGFRAFEAGGTSALPAGIRIFGGRADAGTGTPQFPVAENLEPEYSTISADSTTAWVTLQEANGIAEVDLASATVTAIRDLGTVDRMQVPFDASDRDGAGDANADGTTDGAISVRSWPVKGFRMPDTIDSYEVDGQTYLVTANEGDSRDWNGYSEVLRVEDLAADGPGPVCADAFADSYGVDGLPTDQASFLAEGALGRLNVTTADGFDPAAGCFSELYTFGSRSFSIWDESGVPVFDSGAALEQITAAASPTFFNSNHVGSGFDGRSDDKGPEPEAVTLGEIGGRTYAFLGFERIGGVAVFDVTVPASSTFVTYLNNRDFAVSAEDDGLTGAGDLGPESITFISAADSPSGIPLLGVGNEVSGSTTLFAIDVAAVPGTGGSGTGGSGVGGVGSGAGAPELAATGAVSGDLLWLGAPLLGVGLVLTLVASARRGRDRGTGSRPSSSGV